MSQQLSQITLETSIDKHTVTFDKYGFIAGKLLVLLFVGLCWLSVAINQIGHKISFALLLSTAITAVILLALLVNAFGKIKIEIGKEKITIRKPRLCFWINEELKTSQIKKWYFDVKETSIGQRIYKLKAELPMGETVSIASNVQFKKYDEEANALIQILNDSTKFYQSTHL